MNENIFLYFSTFISVLTAIFFSYIFFLNKKINKKKNGRAEISGQRERIESRIYELNEIMLSDPERLFDNTQLLLQIPDKELIVNHRIPNYSFFQNLGLDITNVTLKENSIFCLMPFHKSFQKTYNTIEVACEKADYMCFRSDITYSPGNILRQIIQSLLHSQLIIAVLDGKNPNVFYEIGIAHSIGKTVILIANSNKTDDIPFNLQSDRLILYSNYNDLQEKLIKALKNTHYVE